MNKKTYMNIANHLLNEEVVDGEAVNIYYSDLDLQTRTDILKIIDEDNQNIDVFGDEIVKEKIEEELSRKPLVMLTVDDITNRMNFEF
tara:strand:- start:13456 stop:13719 length:264 start_codon:yes stop_codon:yes gene_type:complete